MALAIRPQTGRQDPFVEGARAMAPVVGALAPLGFVVGATVAESSVEPAVGLATAPLIFGASGQLVAIRMLDSGAMPLLIVATVALVSVRLAFYGAAMAPHWRHASLPWKVFACAVLVEPTFALGAAHAQQAPDAASHRRYYTGAGVVLWSGWLVATGAGVLLGGQLGGFVPHDPVRVLALVALAIPAALATSSTRWAALTAAVAMCALGGLPHGTGVVLAGGIGILVGARHEERLS